MKRRDLEAVFLFTMLTIIIILLVINFNRTNKAIAIAKENLEVTVQQAEFETVPEAEAEEGQLTSLGIYKVSHYCACEKCCGKSNGITASGTVAQEGRTCAAEGLAIGTHVLIAETGEVLTVEDRFGDPSLTNRIDIFVSDHDRALQLGAYESEVYIVEFPE